MHPSLGGEGLQALEHARGRTLEIMVHPQRKPEEAALVSGEWRTALATLTLGSYTDFARLAGAAAEEPYPSTLPFAPGTRS